MEEKDEAAYEQETAHGTGTSADGAEKVLYDNAYYSIYERTNQWIQKKFCLTWRSGLKTSIRSGCEMMKLLTLPGWTLGSGRLPGHIR